ncbi:MAG: WbqC family protein [Deltaproteobacteria bacterium]|nr:WbqC family protein [Deltaproteobacteria bacterium]MBW1993517.1 WbqC family protein [Deltaproteobacteria bacterium]MBW2151942.1 WbqC family protein [Deltaproteobacteria bacterium]
MRGCILQPGYLPWLGFFEQFVFSEVFVFLDDVQYTKQDWRNRNRIRTNSDRGWSWITVPVKVKGTHTKICEVKIDYSRNWIKKHLNMIRANYQKAPFFNSIFSIIREGLYGRFETLVDLNIHLILGFASYLDLHRQTIRSSSLTVKEKDKNLRLVAICKQTGIHHLYDGKKAEAFLDLSLFAKHDIRVEFQNYDHPVYEQCYDPFIPYLSIVDLLFNHGKNSLDILLQ